MILESKKTGRKISVTNEEYAKLKTLGHAQNFKVVSREEEEIIPEVNFDFLTKKEIKESKEPKGNKEPKKEV